MYSGNLWALALGLCFVIWQSGYLSTAFRALEMTLARPLGTSSQILCPSWHHNAAPVGHTAAPVGHIAAPVGNIAPTGVALCPTGAALLPFSAPTDAPKL